MYVNWRGTRYKFNLIVYKQFGFSSWDSECEGVRRMNFYIPSPFQWIKGKITSFRVWNSQTQMPWELTEIPMSRIRYADYLQSKQNVCYFKRRKNQILKQRMLPDGDIGECNDIY